MTNTKPNSKSQSKSRRLIKIALTFLLSALLGEGLCRLLLFQKLNPKKDERSLAYRYHERLGWFPQANSETTLKGSQKFHSRHNSKGFREQPIADKTRPRIIFIGDSFVWGYDVEAQQRFTDLLKATNSKFECLNLGVSGYGTDQAYLLLQSSYPKLKPDRVVHIVSYNDVQETNQNVVHGGYNKPYFKRAQGQLISAGIPVPKPLHFLIQERSALSHSYLYRALFLARLSLTRSHLDNRGHDLTVQLIVAMKNFCDERNLKFYTGVQTPDEALKSAIKNSGIELIDLSGAEQFPGFGRHWTVAGHKEIARRLQPCFNDH
jgi:hypothetical protein